MANAAELMLLFKGDASGAQGAVSGLESKLGGLGKTIAGAGIGAAAGKAAQEIVGIGTAFDDVYDGMVVQTGATGEQLAGLQQSFRDVVANVPTDFQSAGEAVATLNQRLGLTGEPLTGLATQMANLARITGTDVTANANAAADVFGRWNVAAADQAGVLDTLFAASQQSGVGFDRLTTNLQQFAPQLQAMGMGLDEAAAMLGSMGQAGLDAERVMPGLTKALREAAKAGQEPSEALSELFAKVKAEGPTSATAMEAFGRSGLDVANAVAQGKLDYEAFAAALAANTSTINDTAASTDDMQQKFDLLKNKVMLAAEGFAPLGMTMQPFVGMLPMLGSGIGALVGHFGGLGGAVAGLPGMFGPLLGILAPPTGLIILAIAAVIAVGALLIKHWDDIKAAAASIGAKLSEAWTSAKAAVGKAIDGLREGIAEKWEEIRARLSEHAETIKLILVGMFTGPLGIIVALLVQHRADIAAKFSEIRDSIAAKLQEIWTDVTTKWDEIKMFIGDTLSSIAEDIRLKWDAFLREIRTKLEAILGSVTEKWEAVKTSITDKLDSIRTVLAQKWEEYRRLVADKLDEIKGVITEKWEQAKALVDKALGEIRDVIRTLIEGWKTVVTGALKIADWLYDTISGAVERVRDAISRVLGGVVQTEIAGLKTVVTGALKIGEWIAERFGFRDEFKAAIAKLKEVGGQLIAGMKQGISDAFHNFAEWFKGLFPNIMEIARQILGLGSPSRVFAQYGEWTMEGFFAGIGRRFGRDAPRMGALLQGWTDAFGEKLEGGTGIARGRLASGTAGQLPGLGASPGLGARSKPVASTVPVEVKGGALSGELTMRDQPVIRLVIGSRELDVLADEIVRRVEARLVLKFSPGVA